jgi:Protein of unknown function (DUF3341)
VSNEDRPYGLVAEFATPEQLISAAREAREAGYRRLDAFSPFPVEGLDALADRRHSALLPLLALAGALAGGGLIYFVQVYMNAIDYPLNVGGRPLHSWPTYLPVTAIVGILTAAVAVTLGMLALSRLPRFHHPLFNVPAFARATQGGFFLCIAADDTAFSIDETRRFLEGLRPRSVSEVPW